MLIEDQDLVVAIDRLKNDTTTPAHLKTILAHLLERCVEKDNELASMKATNTELLSENTRLKNEISSLKASLSVSKDSAVNSLNLRAPHDCSFEERERLRSVVVAGVVECRDPNAMLCVSHDLDCIRNILQFLDVNCMPLIIYRLGKRSADRIRLIKVVQPSRFFHAAVLRKSLKLRFFSVKGIFICPPLTKEQRAQLLAVRDHSNNVPQTTSVAVTSMSMSPRARRPSPTHASILLNSQISSNQEPAPAVNS